MRILALILFLLPIQALAQTYPDYTSPFVNDFAGLLSPASQARITTMLQHVRQERGVEMTVVTINSLSDYGDDLTIEGFATGLFNQWGVGDAARNDGIMVLVSFADREMRLELGAGYPASFDRRAKRVIEYYFLPWFKKGDYETGIESGVAEAIKRLEPNEGDMKARLTSNLKEVGLTMRDSTRSGGLFAWIFGALGLTGSGFGAWIIRRYFRNKPRDCDICGRKMVRLSEQADDQWLAHGQKVEESLASKDYDVWYCKSDDHVMIQGYRNWFSSFSACPNCGFRTLHSNRTVLQAATTSNTGRARIDYNCRNCDHSYSEHVSIARISKSSSSGGSSFGGGSSSGGGASGSW